MRQKLFRLAVAAISALIDAMRKSCWRALDRKKKTVGEWKNKTKRAQLLLRL